MNRCKLYEDDIRQLLEGQPYQFRIGNSIEILSVLGDKLVEVFMNNNEQVTCVVLGETVYVRICLPATEFIAHVLPSIITACSLRDYTYAETMIRGYIEDKEERERIFRRAIASTN